MRGSDICYDAALEVLKDYPAIETWAFNNRELEQFSKLIIRNFVVDFYQNYLELNGNTDIVTQVEKYISSQFNVN